MPTPHLAGTAAPGQTTTKTVVTITSSTGAGNSIIVAANVPLSSSLTVTSVTDSKGNTYTQAKSTIAGLSVWIALGTTALLSTGTADTVTVNWSTTGSWAKNVIVCDSPGIASTLALDSATNTNTDASTAVSVTSGVPAGTGELALFIISDSNSGGVPSALGSFTSLSTIHNTTFQYLTVAYLTAGAGAVTATATLAGTPTWAAFIVLLSPTPIGAGGGGAGGVLVGADIDQGSYSGTLTQNISTWVNSVINPGRTLDSIRVFFGTNIPSSFAASGLAQHAGVRRVLMSMKPTTGSVTDRDTIDNFLSQCQAAGLDAKVTLNHEPAPEMTAAEYKASVAYFAPTIRKYYPYVYCQAAYRTHVIPTTPTDYYPGDAYTDECAYDFYEYDWRLYGQTLNSMASVADAHGLPFSCWELGVVVGGVGGGPAGSPGSATHAQGTAYMNYVTNFFKNRQAAAKPIGDISYYNFVNAAKNWDHVIQPGSYLAPLYDALYDALSGSGGTTNVNMAASPFSNDTVNAILQAIASGQDAVYTANYLTDIYGGLSGSTTVSMSAAPFSIDSLAAILVGPAVPPLPLHGLPRSGDARPHVPQYTYLVTDLRSGTVLGELPLHGVTLDDQLNLAGNMVAAANLDDPMIDNDEFIARTTPGKTAFWAYREDQIVWGGILWSRMWEAKGKTFSFSGQTFDSYAARRFPRSWLGVTVKKFVNQGQSSIIQALWAGMQGVPGGNIRVQPWDHFSSDDVQRNLTVNGWDLSASFDDIIQKILTFDNGPDYTVIYNEDGFGLPRAQLRVEPLIGNPIGATDLVVDYPGSISDYSYNENASGGNNQWWAVGDGQGAKTKVGVATDQNLLNSGWPLLEGVNSFSGAKTQDEVDAHARSDLKSLPSPLITHGADLFGSRMPEFGSYGQGDYVIVKVLDPRFTQGRTFAVRAIGWSIQPPDGGQGVENIALVFDEQTGSGGGSSGA